MNWRRFARGGLSSGHQLLTEWTRTSDVDKRDPEQTWGCNRLIVIKWRQAQYPVNYGGHIYAIRCLGGNDDCGSVGRSAARGSG
jgi:hypothetical protein